MPSPVNIDAATRALYDRVRRSSEFIAHIERLRPAARLEAAVVIVPGAFHRTHQWTGADGGSIRIEAERLGAHTDVIPLPNLASRRHNARHICDWLKQQKHEAIILVSLSKGSADVKLALAEPDASDAFVHVAAWVNISGALDGTPLVNWLMASRLRWYCTRFLLWVRRRNADAVWDLAHDPGVPLTPPAHLKIVHVIGFPERKNLTGGWARWSHRCLASVGPNDGGGLLLTDVLRWPGIVYPVWGADHYLHGVSNVARQVLSYVAEIIRVEVPA